VLNKNNKNIPIAQGLKALVYTRLRERFGGAKPRERG
jgi:hypothetical protein